MLCMLHAARRIVAMQNASTTLLKPTCCACVLMRRGRREWVCARHVQVREACGELTCELASLADRASWRSFLCLPPLFPGLPAARKPLNPSGIHPKRAGTAWDASRPWCGGLRPMPQPTVERLEPGARALQNLNTNLIQFNTI